MPGGFLIISIEINLTFYWLPDMNHEIYKNSIKHW